MKKILLSTFVAAGMATTATAGDLATTPAEKNPIAPAVEPAGLYNAKEYQLDLYGTHSFGNPGGPDGWGGGAAINYFFTENFGLGAEAMAYELPGDTLGTAALDAFYRMPIGDSGFAVYGYIGAGLIYNIEDLDWDDLSDTWDRFFDGEDAAPDADVLLEWHLGGGIEYRCDSRMGFFVDGRYTWTDQDDFDFATVRSGIRITF